MLWNAPLAWWNGERVVQPSLPSFHRPESSVWTRRCDLTSMTRMPRLGAGTTKSASPSNCVM